MQTEGAELVRRLPMYCVEDIDERGNVRVYFRRRGAKKIRVPGVAWDAEFMEAYGQMLKGIYIVQVRPGYKFSTPQTWRWLCEQYFASADFLRLSARTRYVRRAILEKTSDEPVHKDSTDTSIFGDMPIERMTAKNIRALRDRKLATPEAANSRLKSIRQVFVYAMEAELAERNAARDVPFFKTASEGFYSWEDKDFRQYRAFHKSGTKARMMLELLICFGGRRADAPVLGKQHMQKKEIEVNGETVTINILKYTQQKNQHRNPVHMEVPVLPALQAEIDAMPEGQILFLLTEFGKPFTANGIGNWFKRQCVAAGLPHCSAHGVRKGSATNAADNGSTEKQLMAMYGWKDHKQPAHYTLKANMKKLALSGSRTLRLGDKA